MSQKRASVILSRLFDAQEDLQRESPHAPYGADIVGVRKRRRAEQIGFPSVGLGTASPYRGFVRKVETKRSSSSGPGHIVFPATGLASSNCFAGSQLLATWYGVTGLAHLGEQLSFHLAARKPVLFIELLYGAVLNQHTQLLAEFVAVTLPP
uniref:hypothetical protein n=1 Tax=Bradyrhizobium sp. USDA 3456 TaxID=546901 RepID=UPI001143659F